MRLAAGFSALLVSLLAATSIIDARPTAPGAGLVTLPLRSLAQRDNDIHPQLLFQQHLNRAHRRHARLAGHPVPSKLKLRENMIKRAMAIEATGSDTGLAKRFSNGDNARAKLAAYREAHHAADAPESKRFLRPTSQLQQFREAAAEKLAGREVVARHGHHHPLGADEVNEDRVRGHRGGFGGQGGGNGGGNGNGNGNGSGNGNSQSAANSQADLAGPGFNEAELNAANSGGLTLANTPDASDSLGLDIEANDVGYIATVQFGTPPRDFKILMDSGSADLWVGSENCVSESGGGCGNHVFLGSNSSSTFQETNTPFEVTYGTGDVQGNLVTDDVSIAGLALQAHQFGVAHNESVDFSANNVPFDGLMGLALSSISQQQVPTPPESLASAGLIKSAITSFKLSRLSDDKNDGEITFGGLDSAKFQANTLVTFDNVNQNGFWEGNLAITVDGNTVISGGRTGILDTGTSLIVAPPDDAATFHQAIPGAQSDGQGGFTIPCTTSVQVAFQMGGGTFALNPQDLLFVPVDPNNLTGDCQSAVSAGQIGGPQEWLLGDVFLKNVYFSVDVSNNQVSLASLA